MLVLMWCDVVVEVEVDVVVDEKKRFGQEVPVLCAWIYFLNEGSDCHFSSMMTLHFLNISVSSLEIRFVGPEGDRTASWEMLECREVIFFQLKRDILNDALSGQWEC